LTRIGFASEIEAKPPKPVKRIAILGARGQLGSLLHQSLKNRSEYDILALSRKPGPGYLHFDARTDDWKRLGKVDVFLNVAGIIRESKNEAFFEVHTELLRTLIENRHGIGNPRILHVSVLGSNDDSGSAFLNSKAKGEAIVLKQNDALVLRPSLLCLPNNLLVQKMILLLDISRYLGNRALLPATFPQHKIQPVMPQDVLEAIERAVQVDALPMKILDLVGPEPISFGELMNLAAKLRNQRLIPIEIPKNLVDIVTRNFISVWFPEILDYEQFKLLFKDNVGDSSHLQNWLGREPLSSTEFWISAFSKPD
jgi:uncharacterized protein YbjT (DUF2867 family)